MVLTKAELLNGAKTYDEYELKSVNDSINLRPLTIGEIHKISEMKNKAFAMLQERLSNGTISIEEFNKKCHELGKQSK